MLDIILIIVGFLFLIKGADVLVDNSSSLAKRFNIPDIVIGLTIVAFGTSAPELAVNVLASIKGSSAISIGNILGSNIVNILFILGVSSLILPLSVKKETVWKEIPLSLLAGIVLFFMANDSLIDGSSSSVLSVSDGLVLISFFVIFFYYVVNMAVDEKMSSTEEEFADKKEDSIFYLVFLIFLGLGALVIGGKMVVDSAINIALLFGISQALIGFTIVAIGTSLPELFTSSVAAYKGKADIAVGNVVGSNIFNIFWILGISSIISPIPFENYYNFDISIEIFSSFLLFIFMFIGKKHILERWQGALFIVLYFIYIGFLVVRG